MDGRITKDRKSSWLGKIWRMMDIRIVILTELMTD